MAPPRPKKTVPKKDAEKCKKCDEDFLEKFEEACKVISGEDECENLKRGKTARDFARFVLDDYLEAKKFGDDEAAKKVEAVLGGNPEEYAREYYRCRGRSCGIPNGDLEEKVKDKAEMLYLPDGKREKLMDAVLKVWDGAVSPAEAHGEDGPFYDIARHLVTEFAEETAARLLPEAKPGIQAEKCDDCIILYRTARSAQEVRQVLEAAAEGKPTDAFSPSTHIAPEIVGHGGAFIRKLNASARRGGKPVFTTPYPSVAGFYRRYSPPDDAAPITFAIEVPKDAVIHESSRVAQTKGRAYSLVYPDTEIIVDANKIKRVWVVPGELVSKMTNSAEEINEKLTVRGAYPGAYKDRDEALAEAAAEAIADLREPPASLGRPFVEEPVELASGVRVKKGDRVVLSDGQVVKIVGWRSFGKEGRIVPSKFRPPEASAFVELSGYKQPGGIGEYGYENLYPNALNFPDSLVAAKVEQGERITKKRKEEILRGQKKKFREHLEHEIAGAERVLRAESFEKDEQRAKALRRRIENTKKIVEEFQSEERPASSE